MTYIKIGKDVEDLTIYDVSGYKCNIDDNMYIWKDVTGRLKGHGPDEILYDKQLDKIYEKDTGKDIRTIKGVRPTPVIIEEDENEDEQ